MVQRNRGRDTERNSYKSIKCSQCGGEMKNTPVQWIKDDVLGKEYPDYSLRSVFFCNNCNYAEREQ
jgi:hypothetical protein